MRIPHLQSNAADCLFELVHKGMPTLAKLELLICTRIVENISGIPIALDNEDASMSMASLVDILGCTLIDIWCDVRNSMPEQANQTKTLLESVMSMVWPILMHLNYDVSGTILTFLSQIFDLLKKDIIKQKRALKMNAASGDIDLTVEDALGTRNLIPQLLQCISSRAQYPESYLFDSSIGDDVPFDRYRHSLQKLFVVVCKVDMNTVIAFINKLFYTTTPVDSLHLIPASQCELMITMLIWMGEGYSPQQLKQAVQGGPFSDLIRKVLSSMVFEHPHFSPVLQYMELMVRYSSVVSNVPDCSQLTNHILTAMVQVTFIL